MNLDDMVNSDREEDRLYAAVHPDLSAEQIEKLLDDKITKVKRELSMYIQGDKLTDLQIVNIFEAMRLRALDRGKLCPWGKVYGEFANKYSQLGAGKWRWVVEQIDIGIKMRSIF